MVSTHRAKALAWASLPLFTLIHDGNSNLFSPENIQIMLNPTHEIIYRFGQDSTFYPAGDQLIYASADSYVLESVLSFDVSMADDPDALSSAILKLYLLSGLNATFQVDGLDYFIDPDSSCESMCWIAVDLTESLLWTIEESYNPSRLNIGIAAEENEGYFASSSYKGGRFAPILVLDYQENQGLQPIDFARSKILKGADRNKKDKKKQKQKKKQKKRKPKKKPGKKDKPKKPGKTKPKKGNGKKPIGKTHIGGKDTSILKSKPKPGRNPKPSTTPIGLQKPTKPSRPTNYEGSNSIGKQPKPSSPTPKPIPASPTSVSTRTLQLLNKKESIVTQQLLLYEDPIKGKIPSVYTFSGLMNSLSLMSSKGVAGKTFYLGNENGRKGNTYGLVNIAAFLAQSMKETIKYNACDENSWDLVDGQYPLSNACGQLGQSYQDYHCPAHEKHMECDVDPKMEITAITHATWYGAPGPLYCKPKASKNDFSGYWDYQFDCNNPWADPPTKCDVYEGQRAGMYNNTIPVANSGGRTDVEGCCWWGRGVIQTTGICNFGKLNYYLGARAAQEGRQSPYPDVDFCKNPEAICSSTKYKELKWVAGIYYWMESVQRYNSEGWNYMEQLHAFVDGGLVDPSFINAVSGIVNRGCHDPPCGTGEVDGQMERSACCFRAQEFQWILWSNRVSNEAGNSVLITGIIIATLL